MRQLSLLLIVLIAVGCNQRDADNLQRDAGNLAQSAGTAISNASLGGKINMVLTWRKDLDISGLKIDAQDSTVNLSGHMPTEEEHKTVLDLVKGIKGADKVNDAIVVP